MREDDGTFICDSSEFPLCKTALNIDDRVCWRCGSSEIRATAQQQSVSAYDSKEIPLEFKMFDPANIPSSTRTLSEQIARLHLPDGSPDRVVKVYNAPAIDELWLEYLTDDGRCGLCLNKGTIQFLSSTADHSTKPKPCICPNGRAIKAQQTND